MWVCFWCRNRDFLIYVVFAVWFGIQFVKNIASLVLIVNDKDFVSLAVEICPLFSYHSNLCKFSPIYCEFILAEMCDAFLNDSMTYIITYSLSSNSMILISVEPIDVSVHYFQFFPSIASISCTIRLMLRVKYLQNIQFYHHINNLQRVFWENKIQFIFHCFEMMGILLWWKLWWSMSDKHDRHVL